MPSITQAFYRTKDIRQKKDRHINGNVFNKLCAKEKALIRYNLLHFPCNDISQNKNSSNREIASREYLDYVF